MVTESAAVRRGEIEEKSGELRDEKRGRVSKTVGYFAAFVALGLTVGSFGPTLPALAAQTRTGLSAISLLFTVRSLGYLLGSLGWGKLYDRHAGHPVMAAMLLIMALMMAIVPVMGQLWLLAIVLLILGAAEGTLDVGGNTLLVWVHGDRAGAYLSGLHFFFGVGALGSPIIVAQTLSLDHNPALPYWLLAASLLPVSVYLLCSRSPVFQTTSGATSTKRQDRKLVGLIALFFFLYVGAEVGFGGWIYTYAIALKLSDARVAAYLTSAFWGSLTFGRLLAIPMAARFRPRSILLSDLAGCLIGVGIILLRPDSMGAVWGGTILLGLAMASIFPVTLSFAERRMTITGRVTGWFIVGASAGSMLLPWVMGQLFAATGPASSMLVVLSALTAATVVFITMIRRPTLTATTAEGITFGAKIFCKDCVDYSTNRVDEVIT